LDNGGIWQFRKPIHGLLQKCQAVSKIGAQSYMYDFSGSHKQKKVGGPAGRPPQDTRAFWQNSGWMQFAE